MPGSSDRPGTASRARLSRELRASWFPTEKSWCENQKQRTLGARQAKSTAVHGRVTSEMQLFLSLGLLDWDEFSTDGHLMCQESELTSSMASDTERQVVFQQDRIFTFRLPRMN